MSEFLEAGRSAHPERPALAAADRSWTYAELSEVVGRWAAAVEDRAAGTGPVVLLLRPGAEGVAAVHAVARTGRTVVPLNPRFTAGELVPALSVLGPSLVLCDASTEVLARDGLRAAETASAGAFQVRPVRVEALPPMEVVGGGQSPPVDPPMVREATSWAVLWTSGTAGRSRGVALSAESLRRSAEGARERLDLSPEDRWYQALSLTHVGGLALVTRAALVGSCVVVRGGFGGGELTTLAEAGEVTHVSLVPTMLHRFLEGSGVSAFARLGCALVGGARASRPLIDRAVEAGVPLALTYGLTEATSQVATAPPELVRRKPGTAGAPLPGVEVCISEAGEVLVRGPTVAVSYVGTREPLVDGEGWLHTEDLGELDGDGHLWVTGRYGDRIITGGVNVDPAEVEDVLLLHDGVADAAVVGVDDLEWGEVVAAAVVRAPGIYPDPAELETLTRARLTSAKIPRRWLFLEMLPRNANGKVDREGLRGAFA